jgi:beta-glucosidase
MENHMKIDVKDLSLDEKVDLVMGKDDRTTNDLDGKVPSVVVSDGPVGLRHVNLKKIPEVYEVMKSVAYPSFQLLSQTRDLSLARKMGEAIANDCIDLDVDVILAPGLNIKRNPLNGRNFEYFSEDPLVAGTFAREYVRGVQSCNVGACVKHFCCNNLEYSRNRLSMEVDTRTLREIYLRAFEIAFEAKPWSMMCSYNLLNGVRMSENEKLFNIARDEFGFDGLIMSDWWASKEHKASIEATLNLIMPFDKEGKEKLKKQVKDGEVDIAKLDYDAGKVLELVYKVEDSRKKRKTTMSVTERIDLAKEIAENGMVLAKNNGILPLNRKVHLLVTGAPAHFYYYGGGSSEVTPLNPYQTLDSAFKDIGVDALFSESVRETLGEESNMGNIHQAFVDALTKDVIIMTVGDNSTRETESRDRENINLSSAEIDAIKFLKKTGKPIILVVYAGAAVNLSTVYDDVDAILFAGYGGEKVSLVAAEIIVGIVNPSGRLTETYPLKLEDVPAVNTYKDQACLVYSEGLNVGYRYFETYDVPVLFPFGFGLSYSEFKYSEIRVEKDGENVKVSCDIENTSKIDGKEVVQLYIEDLSRHVYRPKEELKAFTKAELKAGEKKNVTFILNKRDFEYYSTIYESWHLDHGIFKIDIAKNSHEIVLSSSIEY